MRWLGCNLFIDLSVSLSGWGEITRELANHDHQDPRSDRQSRPILDEPEPFDCENSDRYEDEVQAPRRDIFDLEALQRFPIHGGSTPVAA
jgi:hypothetical protein